eukprot:TRINITY_DN93816_c0_g1_i1.p1 TRINITY_DN93816_c0_g1~~TRINITY_DN93816_c0_g1_i1.p1  ORF type:complete len:254 (-),score=27.14 TRINITY_DN93816_c0_g1_i1:72-785(-)
MGRRGESKSKSRSSSRGRGRRDSRSRGSGRSRYSPPPRARSWNPDQVRRGRKSRSRSRSRSRSGKPAKAPKPGDKEYRIPPPKRRTSDDASNKLITPEMRAASIECEGWLYATIDFTPPTQSPPWTTTPPKSYNAWYVKTDASVIKNKTLPKGWELVTSPPEDVVKDKVIKPFPWGTHLLVLEGGNSYWTHGGDNPGTMETIWDYDKYPGRFALKAKHGRLAPLHGNFFIKIKDSNA